MAATQPVTLRVLGTSVTLLESLRLRAEQDLGIRLVYQVHDVEQAQRIAVMQPDSYDLYDQWFHNVDFVWPARAIQPIDTRRIALWHEINDLPKRGRLSPTDRLGSGSVRGDLQADSGNAAIGQRGALGEDDASSRIDLGVGRVALRLQAYHPLSVGLG